MQSDSCGHNSFLPHQASVEDQFTSYRGTVPKGKAFHPRAILQNKVRRLGLGVEEEREGGWRVGGRVQEHDEPTFTQDQNNVFTQAGRDQGRNLETGW